MSSWLPPDRDARAALPINARHERACYNKIARHAPDLPSRATSNNILLTSGESGLKMTQRVQSYAKLSKRRRR
jgi:hypothetical protein